MRLLGAATLWRLPVGGLAVAWFARGPGKDAGCRGSALRNLAALALALEGFAVDGPCRLHQHGAIAERARNDGTAGHRPPFAQRFHEDHHVIPLHGIALIAGAQRARGRCVAAHAVRAERDHLLRARVQLWSSQLPLERRVVGAVAHYHRQALAAGRGRTGEVEIVPCSEQRVLRWGGLIRGGLRLALSGLQRAIKLAHLGLAITARLELGIRLHRRTTGGQRKGRERYNREPRGERHGRSNPRAWPFSPWPCLTGLHRFSRGYVISWIPALAGTLVRGSVCRGATGRPACGSGNHIARFRANFGFVPRLRAHEGMLPAWT